MRDGDRRVAKASRKYLADNDARGRERGVERLGRGGRSYRRRPVLGDLHRDTR